MGKAQALLLCTAFLGALALHSVCAARERQQAGTGRAVRSQIETLYDLRGKLARSSSPSSSFAASSSSHNNDKEARGYSFSYNPSDITHPAFTNPYASQDFHSRTGKVVETQQQKQKKKNSEKNWDKYYGYKTSSGNGDNMQLVNSFTVFDANSTEDGKVVLIPPTLATTAPTTTLTAKVMKPNSKIFKSSVATTSAPKPSSSSGFDLSKLANLGLGLNDAMTSVLTQKFMGIIDHDFPEGILKPLKHLVSSGNKMVEFWDKRANARDGKPPGIMEMLGYGIEQLKKYRDGQPMKPTDPIANITSPSNTLIQGMVVVKKLTNRVLGYDTNDLGIESRGGDGWGGGWGGHHVSYG